MKLSLNADFTALPRAGRVIRRADRRVADNPFDVAVLAHDERHLRRRVVELAHEERILVDLPAPVALENGDVLVLEDGRQVEIAAGAEDLYEVRARDMVHLAELAWHLGNRHLAAEIAAERILILRDHVIRTMLEGLGATVSEITGPFQPARGAYSGQGHPHGHDERDAHGRSPGDPHYGHNHA